MAWEDWPRVSVKKIDIEQSSEKYFIVIKNYDKNSNSISFSLLNGMDAYESLITIQDLKKMSDTTRIPVSEFMTLTIAALTSGSKTSDTFIYSMKVDSCGLQLTWKKNVPSQEIKLKLGSLLFHSTDNKSEVCNAFQEACTGLIDKKEEIEQLKLEINSLKSANERLRDTLKVHVKTKEELEKEMYTKFVIVLNKKKEKCRQLKDQVAGARPLSSPAKEVSSEVSGTQNDLDKNYDKNDTLDFDDLSDDYMPKTTQRRARKSKTRTIARSKVKPPVVVTKRTRTVASTSALDDTQGLLDEF